MTERHPVDKYSKTDYEAGLAHIAEKEALIGDHPLQNELELHQDLKKETPSTYPFEKEEAEARAALEKETAVLRKEIEQIKKDLQRQFGNAHAEALKINEKMTSDEAAQMVLPEIARIEDSTRRKMEASETLLAPAPDYGKAILKSTEEARREITSRKLVASPARILDIFRGIQELYDKFIEFAGNVLAQTKYGGPLGDTTA